MPDRPRCPTRRTADIKADVVRATEQLRSLVKDPEFLVSGSPTDVEHALVSRRLAVLTAELRDAAPRTTGERYRR